MSASRSLRSLGGWDIVARGRFEARHDGHLWTVDLDYFDFGEKLHLYRDGEASMSLLGMKQVDLIADGETTMLTPVEGTTEAWRLQLERERPELSRLIGAISWTVLVVALIFEVPQLIALAGGNPPFLLPGAANFVLGLAALVAAIERALRFKSDRWLG